MLRSMVRKLNSWYERKERAERAARAAENAAKVSDAMNGLFSFDRMIHSKWSDKPPIDYQAEEDKKNGLNFNTATVYVGELTQFRRDLVAVVKFLNAQNMLVINNDGIDSSTELAGVTSGWIEEIDAWMVDPDPKDVPAPISPLEAQAVLARRRQRQRRDRRMPPHPVVLEAEKKGPAIKELQKKFQDMENTNAPKAPDDLAEQNAAEGVIGLPTEKETVYKLIADDVLEKPSAPVIPSIVIKKSWDATQDYNNVVKSDTIEINLDGNSPLSDQITSLFTFGKPPVPPNESGEGIPPITGA